jgi:hypothetical protein
MSKLLAIALLAAALAGCQREAEEAVRAGDVTVETLFTHDGCTAYRFYDGRYVHFVRCGGRTDTSWQEGCGKSCIRTVSVATTALTPEQFHD